VVGNKDRLIWCALAFSLLVASSSAEWKYDENAMNNCRCFYGCANLCGWGCGMDVGCYYNPKASDASPACANTAGGPCICAGWGCGRCGMISSGKSLEYCNDQWAKPVCGDGKCENRKDESCKTCVKDCGCFSSAECTGKDPKDERGCTDKCAGIECKNKCDGNTLNFGGECDRGIKGCVYKTTACKNGCDNSSWSGARCKDEEDKCKGVVCEGQCDYSGIIWWDGTCNKSSGQCTYAKNATCPKGCAGKDKCVGVIDGVVHYNDATRKPEGVDEPVRNVKIRFEYTDKDGITHKGVDVDDAEFYVWTDDSGRFRWTYAPNFDPEGKITTIFNLNNQKKKFHMTWRDRPNEILDVYFDKNVPVTDKNFTYYNVDPTKSPLPNNGGVAAAVKKYVGMLRAVEYKENNFRKGDTIDERVMLFGNEGAATHRADTAGGDKTGINLPIVRLAFNHPAAPLTEWHEYGHHIQYDEILAAAWNPPGSDHGGYAANPDSQYGFLEGWAEFVAMTMKRDYALGGPGGQYEVAMDVYNIEVNYKVNSVADSMDEELAIAGIMWDLIDSGNDYHGPDDDMLSIWPVEVYDAVATKRDFGDGKGSRNVKSLRDFYVAMNFSGNTYLHDLFPGQNYTKLDQVFIIHNGFQDKNNNSKYDDGEPIGYSGKGATLRNDLEYQNGTEIMLNVKDQSGKPIPNLYARVESNFSAPYAHLSAVNYVPVLDGFVAVPLVPNDYNVTYTITPMQGGTNNTAKDKFIITNQQMLKKFNPKKPLGELTTTVKTAPVKCTTHTECQYWMAGQTCNNKTNTCEGQAGLEKLDVVECGKNIRCSGEKDSILGGLGGGLGDAASNLPCCNLLGVLPLAILAALTKATLKI
jgi:hypothetical protein